MYGSIAYILLTVRWLLLHGLLFYLIVTGAMGCGTVPRIGIAAVGYASADILTVGNEAFDTGVF